MSATRVAYSNLSCQDSNGMALRQPLEVVVCMKSLKVWLYYYFFLAPAAASLTASFTRKSTILMISPMGSGGPSIGN